MIIFSKGYLNMQKLCSVRYAKIENRRTKKEEETHACIWYCCVRGDFSFSPDSII